MGKDSSRSAVRVVGEIFVTIGVVFLLYVVYQLWWTNVLAGFEADRAREQALVNIKNPPNWDGGKPPIGTAFGLMYMPRLKSRVWELPVVQGVEPAQLSRGIGHYPESDLPGQPGNMALAGHRATNGEPLANIDQVKTGDKVYIYTYQGWFTYTLRKDRIVSPTAMWVLKDNPLPAGVLKSDKILTLITCNPRWGSTERWVWWGDQTDFRPIAEGPPPELGVK
ncbi:MAG: class E sortase [Candidatus Nanopelagicales bacterium]